MKLEVLKRRKKELRLTNRDVADRSGVSLGTVNKIFSGATKAPQIDTMKAILNVLRLEEYEFYEGGADGEDFMRSHTPFGAEAAEAEKRMTAREYQDIANREQTELIEGRIVHLTSPAWNHQELVSGVVCAVRSEIAKKGYRYRAVCGPVAVYVPGRDWDSVARPDMVMVADSGKIGVHGLEHVPDFVMEVSSPAAQEKDLIIKPDVYREAGVKELWAVNLREKQVLAYWFGSSFGPEEFKMRAYSFSEPVPLRLLNGFSIVFDSFDLD